MQHRATADCIMVAVHCGVNCTASAISPSLASIYLLLDSTRATCNIVALCRVGGSSTSAIGNTRPLRAPLGKALRIVMARCIMIALLLRGRRRRFDHR